MNRPRLALAAATIAVAALGACGSSTPAGPTPAGSSAGGTASDACAKAALPLVTSGKLTVGTDKPAYEPWFSGDDPTNGKGFESAVAYAVADQLGFATDRRDLGRACRSTTPSRPGRRTSTSTSTSSPITDERKKAVDFSSGYYDVRQAVVELKGAPRRPTTVADLKDAKLGAQVGTTSLHGDQRT